MKIMPEKAYNNINIHSSQDLLTKGNKSDHKEIIGLLKELSALKDAGIINESEFQEKKEILLNKIN
jgi:hypothetical protein